MNRPTIAITLGDMNGISPFIALKSHKEIKNFVNPIYITNRKVMNEASKKLNLSLESDFSIYDVGKEFKIEEGKVTKESGELSFISFKEGVEMAKRGEVEAVVTLPINKEAWSVAGISYKGHTEALEDFFKREAIMMIGCEKLFGAFFTHHIPLKDVPRKIIPERLIPFFLNFYKNIKAEKIAILGLNPHGGDNGVMGKEELKIESAIREANKIVGREVFFGPLVPDTAFTPKSRENFNYFIAMYHDQGLIPLKALYFEESINLSLNLPIIRTSVDHGTAYDKAYKSENISCSSYINAVKEAKRFIFKHI